MPFVQNFHFVSQIDLQIFIEHDINTAVFYAKFRNGLTAEQ